MKSNSYIKFTDEQLSKIGVECVALVHEINNDFGVAVARELLKGSR